MNNKPNTLKRNVTLSMAVYTVYRGTAEKEKQKAIHQSAKVRVELTFFFAFIFFFNDSSPFFLV